MTDELPLDTYKLEVDGSFLVWPADIPEDAYTLIYTHSNLSLNQRKQKLLHDVLYEAWAFDGVKSWHIWNRHGDWVCTVYDTEKDKEDKDETSDKKNNRVHFIRREQLLLDHIARTVKKKKLIVHERIAYDEDAQAYIAYACPIQLSD